MATPGGYSIARLVGGTLFFTVCYTVLFFAATNLFYWYLNKRFLYEELLVDADYLMYDWVGNAMATVTLAVSILVVELIRHIAARRRFNSLSRARS